MFETGYVIVDRAAGYWVELV